MKSKLLLSLACLLLSAVSGHAAFLHPVPQSEQDFLYAVRQVESGDRYDCPPGRAGELGAYQFRREVWSQYTRASFAEARTPGSDEVASRHYNWIMAQLAARRLAATPWNVAVAWNAGINAVGTRHIPASTRDYAGRVVNLVQDEARLRASLTPKFSIALANN